MNGRKSTYRAKLEAAIQQERLLKWKEHFKNLLGNFPEISDKPIKKIINDKLDIKLEQFTSEEIVAWLKKIKSKKAAGFDETLREVWKSGIFDDILLGLYSTAYKQNTIEK